MTFQINLQIIVQAAEEAFVEANKEIGEIFQEEVPVDSGRLKRSYKLTFPAPGEASHDWEEDYAVYVHEDVTYKNGTTRKGRKWTANGLARYEEIYNNKLREKLQ